MRAWRSNPAAARWWHIATVLVIAASLGVQLVLVIQGTNVLVEDGEEAPGAAMRVVNFFSFFTVQSNILLAAGSAVLAKDPGFDGGRLWRVVRLAGLIGISVTGVVYVTLLRGLVDLEGAAAVTNVGFHYLSPLLGAIGWALFGPWPRFDRRVLLVSLAWPVAWLAYTLVRGEIVDWYPYPFIDVGELGYARTLVNSAGVTVLLLGVGWLFLTGDRRLGDRAGTQPADELPDRR
ncbi:Pr6Pr family membrane protein [Jiangella gansuensis]|uniref:Pr6Pr family membrane protein n=1 Tax=Jiangella gansuensis TaxID=281473 RepID=UPI00047CFD00|nr:Pr6Pr family membrane protein [Jiangella gansuensis]